MELSRDEEQRKSERAWIYGERAQPRSHFVKEWSIIYSDIVEQHLEHLHKVFAVLQREKLYLSRDKMQLFASELKDLGRSIDENGIHMDPHKVL
jgi:hypothetical protein